VDFICAPKKFSIVKLIDPPLGSSGVEGSNFATYQAKAGLVPDEHFMQISVAQQVVDWKPI
jgi:hypothetical protein